MTNVLSPTMTVRDFENGYWYLDQLKKFAKRISIPAAKKLRKDELEKAIVAFLRTGNAALPTKRSLRKTGVKDIARGLKLKLRIENYTSNRETKDFIVAQARMTAPDVREKSEVWYRLNRWREEQITSGKHPTYDDLVRQYIDLNKMDRFKRVPHGRYINFVADFLEADKSATRAEAIAAWAKLKELDVPKDYVSWLKARAKHNGKNRCFVLTRLTIVSAMHIAIHYSHSVKLVPSYCSEAFQVSSQNEGVDQKSLGARVHRQYRNKGVLQRTQAMSEAQIA
jgi:SAP domain-containing new25